ncbi:unnamed protein product [Lasius platythorax]|uniref:Uncharacterized protein n=1 Tax=Lasius platythorax TaxID=488582 RepID=A0AAV2P888_9HYME
MEKSVLEFSSRHERNATFGNRISLLGYRGVCLLEAMDVDGWMDGRFAYAEEGTTHCVNNDRVSGARTLPACLRLVEPQVERVLFSQSGKPIRF